MKKGTLLLAVVFSLLFVPLAFAGGSSVWDKAKSEKYGEKAGGMLGRGLVNIGTCFLDVIVQTVEGTESGTPFVGTLTGLGSGIGCTALRVTSGALDVLTFWAPGFNGMPVSKSYSNCLEFDEETPAPAAPVAPAVVAAPEAPAPTPVVIEQPAAPVETTPMDYVKK